MPSQVIEATWPGIEERPMKARMDILLWHD
jgi:hypothetical protein